MIMQKLLPGTDITDYVGVTVKACPNLSIFYNINKDNQQKWVLFMVLDKAYESNGFLD